MARWSGTNLSFAVFLMHSCTSILATVCVSGTTPFLLSERAGVTVDVLPLRVAQMVLADELVSICGSILFGNWLDSFGLAIICALSHAITSLGIVCLAQLSTNFTRALLSRLVFAFGFSGLMVCLVSGIAAFSVAHVDLDKLAKPLRPSEAHETQSLLAPGSGPVRSTGGLLAGFVNITTALGAVLAALGLNRLPVLIGIAKTYYIVAAIEIAMVFSIVAFLRVPRAARPTEANYLKSLLRGFGFLLRDGQIALACAASFASRAQTVVLMTFLPAVVAEYFIRSGFCRSTDPDLPLEYLKKGCRAAYALSSSLTGSSQLISLCAAPLCGLALHKLAPRPPLYLILGYVAGATGFILLFTLPNGDPRVLLQAMPAVSLIGLSQASGMVTSMAMVGDARLRYERQEETAGAISGVYGLSGSLGIILVTQGGGILARVTAATSVFALQAFVFCAVACFAGLVCLRTRQHM